MRLPILNQQQGILHRLTTIHLWQTDNRARDALYNINMVTYLFRQTNEKLLSQTRALCVANCKWTAALQTDKQMTERHGATDWRLYSQLKIMQIHLLHRSGTVCRSRSGRLRRCKFSAADWKPNFLPGLIQSWLTTSHCTDYYYVTSLFRLRT